MKRFISVLLIIVLSTSVLLNSVFAEDVSMNIEIGMIGDNVQYKFDRANGVVTISGSGATWDFVNMPTGSYPVSPFAIGDNGVKKVVVADEVTYLGNNLFDCSSSLKTVSIAASVVKIGSAFTECQSLETVYFDGNSPDISKFAFARDRSEKDIVLYFRPDKKMPDITPLNCTLATYHEDEIAFVDLKEDAFYYDAVRWATKQSITNGTTSITFSPDAPCTRAEAVTFLWRSVGCPIVDESISFTDIPKGCYYEAAVAWAAQEGITLGTSGTTFSPNENCTRGQIVTFLYRLENTETAAIINPFEDLDINAFYYVPVLWAVSEGITIGTTATTFSPDDKCTRAQIVTFLYRRYS